MNRLRLAVALSFLCAMPALAAMSKDQAKQLIAQYGLPETAEGMLGILNTSMPDAPKLVEAFLTMNVRADREVTYETDGGTKLTRYPLNYLLMFACSDDTTAAMAKLLVDAGADPNTTDPENDWAALAQSHSCPDVIRVLLAAPKKPDVNRLDRNGNTAMHYVVRYGDQRQIESIRMLIDAGFDIARFRMDLLKDARQKPDVIAALGGKPPVASPARGATPRPGKVDWKSLPPYPARTAAEAAKLLERSGAAMTVDEHMWDGITQREPLRLALALQAGAHIHQTRSVTGYTPLVLLAERCDQKDADIQTANAKLLIEGGADLGGLMRTGKRPDPRGGRLPGRRREGVARRGSVAPRALDDRHDRPLQCNQRRARGHRRSAARRRRRSEERAVQRARAGIGKQRDRSVAEEEAEVTPAHARRFVRRGSRRHARRGTLHFVPRRVEFCSGRLDFCPGRVEFCPGRGGLCPKHAHWCEKRVGRKDNGARPCGNGGEPCGTRVSVRRSEACAL
jgi:hypothetical protein